MTPIEWLLSDDTGVSSKAILAVMTGTKAPNYARVPLDASDFGRCYRLLKQFPEWRPRLSEMVAKHPHWEPMVGAWDELTAMYETMCDARGHVSMRAYHARPLEYARLCELINSLDELAS